MPREDFVLPRGGDAALWASRNTVLALRELGVETDTKKMKIGDGVTHWNDLPYITGPVDGDNVDLQVKRDTDVNLSALTTPFLSGQLVYGQTTGKTVIGDGESLFDELPDLRKQFQNVVTVSKSGKKGSADFICSDSQWNSDDECIQAAIDYCATHSIKELWINEGYYIINAQLTGSSDINIKGVGDVTLFSNSLASDLISLSGSVLKTVTGSDVAVGATSIMVSDVTGINPGDLILIYDDTIWDDGSTYASLKTGEIHEVLSVSGSTVNFIDGLINAYTAVNNLSVQVINPIRVNIENIKFLGSSETTANGLVSLTYAKYSIISECILDKGGLRGLHINNSYFVSAEKLKISNCIRDGYGYGISISNACAHVGIQKSKLDMCRHCISLGGDESIGQARDIHIYNNEVYGNGLYHTIDAHACVESIYVNNNIIHANKKSAFTSGAKISEFKNNRVYNGIAVSVRDTTKNMVFLVDSNSLFSCWYGFSDTTEGATIKYLSFSNNDIIDGLYYMLYVTHASIINIVNNNINKSTELYGIRVHSATGGKIQNNIIQNTFRDGIYLIDCSNITLSNNVIENSNGSNTAGQLYESGIALTRCTNLKIFNNDVSDAFGKQRYAIAEYDTCNNNKIKNNTVSGAIIKQILKVGAATVIFNNDGYITENTGTATITTSSTSVVVSHGLVAAPTKYFAFPSANLGNCWIDTVTATQMTIHCSTAPGADTVVSWSAQVV